MFTVSVTLGFAGVLFEKFGSFPNSFASLQTISSILYTENAYNRYNRDARTDGRRDEQTELVYFSF